MDGDRFDNLTRTLAAGRSGATSRRTFLAGLAGSALATAGVLPTRRAAALVSQAQCSNKACKNNPAVCTNGCVCCVYGNGNSRCRPPGQCSPGVVLCPPDLVLGPSGDCVAPTTTTTTTTTTARPSEVVNGGTFVICHEPFNLGPCPAGCTYCAGSVDGSGNFLCLAGATSTQCDTNADCPTGQVCQARRCFPSC